MKSEALAEKQSIKEITRTVVKGAKITFAGNVVSKVSTFLYQLFLTRFLGASNYGLYSLGFSIASLIRAIFSLGVENGIVRFGAIYKGEDNKKSIKGILISGLFISTVFSLLGSILLFSGAEFLSKIFDKTTLSGVLKIFSISIPFCALITITTYSARSFRLMKYDVGINNIFRPIANITIVGLFFLSGFKLRGALYGYLTSAIISAVIGLYLLKRVFPEITSELKPLYQPRKLIRFSLPTLFADISYLLLKQTDRIMLGYFRSSSSVGRYNAASVVSLQSTIFLSAFLPILSPIFSDLHNKRKFCELGSVFKTTTKWIFSLTLPLFLVIIFFSRNVMGVFGSEFYDGWLVLDILIFAQFINFSTGPVGLLLRMVGKQDIDFINNLVMVFVNFVLNIWLIKIYGTLGAALASGLSMFIIHLIRLIEVYKILGVTPYDKRYFKPIFSALLSIPILIVFSNFFTYPFLWIAASIVFGMVYLTILYFFGFDMEDKLLIRFIK